MIYKIDFADHPAKSSFFSPCGQSEAKTKATLQIKSQRAVLRSFALDKHFLTFGKGHA